MSDAAEDDRDLQSTETHDAALDSDPRNDPGSMPRKWPAHLVIPEEDRVGANCTGCETTWSVHKKLSGFRFACAECGAWVEVAEPPDLRTARIGGERGLAVAAADDDMSSPGSALRPIEAMPRDAQGRVVLDLPLGRLYEGEIPTGTPMAPGALRHVEVKARQAWTNRTITEIVAMFLALVAPHAAIYFFLTEKDALRLMPLTSLVGGVLLILVGMSAPHYTFKGLRAARPWFFVEAALACALSVGAAVVYSNLVYELVGADKVMAQQLIEQRQLLGLPLLLVVMAICPAVFEELAFRGLLQGRMGALMGRTTGIGVTAGFFALAHGTSWASPVHIGIGLYLGFLRDRSNSLLPGMLLHFMYNGSLVLIFTAAG